MSTLWSSPHAHWLSRSAPHPDPHSFTPTLPTVLLAVLRNAPTDPEGFTLAIFDSPSQQLTVVDASGHVRLIERSHTDAQALLDLASSTAELPDTGTWRNTWVVKQERTSQPIDRIFALKEGTLKETSVQGFDKTKRTLRDPVGDVEELPAVLWELTGLVLEGREGYVKGEEDQVVLGKVRKVLEGLW